MNAGMSKACIQQNKVKWFIMFCNNRADRKKKKKMLFSRYHNGGCFFCCHWITSWLGMSIGNYQDLLLCLSHSFTFFRCSTAFNHHTQSPFTAIMRERPKESKTPHYIVKHYWQEKQIPLYTHSFSLQMFSLTWDKNSTVAYRSLLQH